jgi:hypothetical protein
MLHDVAQSIEDDTLPGGPREKTIVYHAPFDACDREADYATVWAWFAEHQGHPTSVWLVAGRPPGATLDWYSTATSAIV